MSSYLGSQDSGRELCESKIERITNGGFEEIDLAGSPPLRVIGITEDDFGFKTVIEVADDSVKGQGGRSVRVKGTNGVGKVPNDEPNSDRGRGCDQNPDPHTRGTGSSTVGDGKRQMENSGSIEDRDVGATPDINWGSDPTPHIGMTGGTTTVGAASLEASNSVEGHEASSSGHSGGSGAGTESDESDQSTSIGGTDTNERINISIGRDGRDEENRDERRDENRRRVGEFAGRRRVRINMALVAIFISIILASTCAIIALSLIRLSPLVRELFTGALVTNLVGFLCLHAALFPNRHIRQRATEILVRVGGAAAAVGFLLMLGIRLSLRIIIPACLFVLAVFVLSFRR